MGRLPAGEESLATLLTGPCAQSCRCYQAGPPAPLGPGPTPGWGRCDQVWLMRAECPGSQGRSAPTPAPADTWGANSSANGPKEESTRVRDEQERGAGTIQGSFGCSPGNNMAPGLGMAEGHGQNVGVYRTEIQGNYL